MITIKTNTSSVLASVIAKVRKITETDQLLRTIATNMLPEVKSRIHVDGLAADGNPIGSYSKGYMVLRTGSFKNKGKKDSGFFTKGKQSIVDAKSRRAVKVKKSKESAGSLRPNYNRTSDPKVVISLTRQMENDFSIIPTSRGYGLGYKNQENANKVDYVEATYKKPIFKLTEDEHAKCLATAIEYKNSILNG